MTEYENVFRRKELHDMYSLGEVKPLDDLYQIEDVALTIKEFDKKISFYKEYKTKKRQDVDNAIKVLENQVDFFKSVIISTLAHNKEKSIKFPGSCSVSSRKQQPKWRVKDDEEFIAVLKEAQKAGENVDDVLEEVVQWNVKKQAASKMLLLWETSGKLEKFLKKARKGSGDIVVKDPEKIGVTLKFVKEEEDDDETVAEISVPVKEKEDIESFDSI
jgi:hypothetical protein